MGCCLVSELVRRGHHVEALARKESLKNLPPGCISIEGNARDRNTCAHRVAPADTFVHLIGVSHPSPLKGEQFRAIDLVSAREAAAAAVAVQVQHFVYVSVAQPAPVMKEYQQVRAQGEQIIRDSGLTATFLRPWYVLGPGHRWPYLLVPFYWVLEHIPATREGARRLGLVKLGQMVSTLAYAVENPASGIRILGVPEIRQADGQ